MALWESTWTKLCSMSASLSLGRLLGVAARRRGCRRRRACRSRPRAWPRRRASGDRTRVWATIRLTAGLKPMSSIRSASSRTRTRTLAERDGVAARAGPRAGRGWRRRCRRAGPRRSAGRSRRRRRRRRSAAAWRGRSSRARRRSGWPARGSGPGPGRRRPLPGSIRSTIGMPKASVLPEPVGDWTSRSWPASASPTTICWTGKGLVMLRAASAPTTGLEMPRSANDMK